MRARNARPSQKEDQRRHLRYALGLTVRMTPLDETADRNRAARDWQGVTVDISNGGLALQTHNAIPALHLPVKLWLPLDGLPVRVPVLGVVRRVKRMAPGQQQQVGVQFAW